MKPQEPLVEPRLLPLQLEPPRPDRFEAFVVGPNGPAIEAVRHLLDDPGSGLFLSGPEGSGKSHLLQAVCARAGSSAMYLPLADFARWRCQAHFGFIAAVPESKLKCGANELC